MRLTLKTLFSFIAATFALSLTAAVIIASVPAPTHYYDSAAVAQIIAEAK